MVIKSRWNCPIDTTDLPTFLFGAVDSPLPTTPQFSDADRPDTHSYSLTQCREYMLRMIHGLRSVAGFKEGDRALMFSGNNVFFPTAFLSVLGAGGVFTGANPTYTPGELAYQLKNSGAVMMFAAPDTLKVAREAAKQVGLSPAKVFVFDDTLLDADKGRSQVAYWEKHGDGIRHWSVLVPEKKASNWVVLRTKKESERTAVLNYSSGTTGVPKGVEISHFNILANSSQNFFTRNLAVLKPENEKYICPMPMYHAYGQTFTIVISGKLQVQVYIMKKFDFVNYVKYLSIYKITSLTAVPPIIVAMAKHPIIDEYDLTSLRGGVCGSAPLGRDVTEQFEKRLNSKRPDPSEHFNLKQGWGMTETTCSALGFHPDDHDEEGSVGVLNPNCEGKVVDDDDKEVPAGQKGEVLIRGPNIMKGYWKNAKATAETITPDGWLRTGDIGYYDKDEKWFIVDRKKELIKVKANQVAPAELEAVLLEHPKIADAAVIGIPFAGDERPRAYIVKKPDGQDLSAKEVVKFIEGRLAPHKWITGGVKFEETIPKNPSGKILRRYLRDRAKTEYVDTGDRKAKL